MSRNVYSTPVKHTAPEVLQHLAHLRELHAMRLAQAARPVSAGHASVTATATATTTAMAAHMPARTVGIHKMRTPQKRKKMPKVTTTIRLSPEVLTAFKASGKGWQTRMDAALREVVAQGNVPEPE